jgi:D-ribose pyranase
VEFLIDRVLVAQEAETASPAWVSELRTLLGSAPLVTVEHLELKQVAKQGRATIRTADTTPYANIIIVSG